jgi:hypothetical protein
MVHPPFQPLLKKSYWNLLSGIARNVTLFLNSFYRIARTRIGKRRTVVNAGRFRICDWLVPPRDPVKIKSIAMPA